MQKGTDVVSHEEVIVTQRRSKARAIGDATV